MPVKREAVTTQLYFAEMHSFLYCYTRAYLWSPFIMMVWVYVLRDSVLFLVLSDFSVDVDKTESKAKSKLLIFNGALIRMLSFYLALAAPRMTATSLLGNRAVCLDRIILASLIY